MAIDVILGPWHLTLMLVDLVLTVSCKKGQLLTVQTSPHVPEQALIKGNGTVYKQQMQLVEQLYRLY